MTPPRKGISLTAREKEALSLVADLGLSHWLDARGLDDTYWAAVRALVKIEREK